MAVKPGAYPAAASATSSDAPNGKKPAISGGLFDRLALAGQGLITMAAYHDGEGETPWRKR
jgi:hypothetical protein